MQSPPLTLLRRHGLLLAVVATALAFAVRMRGVGLVFAFFIGPASLLWVFVAATSAFRHPRTRAEKSLVVLSLVVAAGTVIGILNYHTSRDLQDAVRLSAALAEYKRRTGAYPPTLAGSDPGLSERATRLAAKYRLDAHDPVLEYGDVWDLWKRYRYDFGGQRWAVVVSD